MEQEIVIRHRNGGKAGQVERFKLQQYKTLSFGRDGSCEVRFDQDKDDLVSRLHCKLAVEHGNPSLLKLSDAGSRNGTFVNKQRIPGEVTLTPGDVVQLGPGGPEFEFDLDPRPAVAKPTRLASQISMPTREAAPPSAVGGGIGKATVERLIAANAQKRGITQWVVLGAVFVLVAGAVLYAKFLQNGPSADSRLTPSQIASSNLDSVVFFEVGWKLVDVESGRQLYHVAMANKITDETGATKELIPGAPAYVPAFVSVGNSLEPVLTTEDGGGKYRAVGGMHTGSGFVVSPDGFVLTNRHVAASWYTRYQFPDVAGVILQMDEQMNIKGATPIAARSFPAWVPADAKFIINGTPEQGNVRIVQKSISGKFIEGRNDYMDVTFAKNRVRIPGKLARVSDQIDVAMVKLEVPQAMKKVNMFDNYNAIAPGDSICVLGYPSASPVIVGAVQSKDVFRQTSETKVIPDPTLSVGNIGRVIRGQAGLTEGTISSFGDVYQLTVNSTGPGNSGGPVFDDKGRVIGIFTSGTSGNDVRITFAVPIRYGLELMGVSRVM